MCLNPYCNGICSATAPVAEVPTAPTPVLILIVMEYALLHLVNIIASLTIISLNPYCNGICSATKNSRYI